MLRRHEGEVHFFQNIFIPTLIILENLVKFAEAAHAVKRRQFKVFRRYLNGGGYMVADKPQPFRLLLREFKTAFLLIERPRLEAASNIS